MIHHLRGRLTGSGKDFVVVECSGVGFRVLVSAVTRSDLPPEGEICLLRTFPHLREGAAELFGFSSETEREVFLALTGVGGVGPKSALGVISVLGVPGVLSACARQDAAVFTRVPGIGKKLAQRIAHELPDLMKKTAVEAAPVPAGDGPGPASAESEASEALVALGFSRTEAQLAVSGARKELGGEAAADVLVRESLKRLYRPRA